MLNEVLPVPVSGLWHPGAGRLPGDHLVFHLLLQRRQLKYKGLQGHVRGHKARKRQSWDSRPGCGLPGSALNHRLLLLLCTGPEK